MAKRGRPPTKRLEDEIPDTHVDILKRDLNTFVSTITERLGKLEDWQNRFVHDINHAVDLNSIVAELSSSVEGLLTWRSEAKEIIRSGVMEHNHRIPTLQPVVKNQDVAKLEGKLAVLANKVDSNADDILTVKRKYLLPQTYKPEDPSKVINDSISTIERKLDSHEELITKLQTSKKEMNEKIDTASKAIQEIKTTKVMMEDSMKA